MLKFLFGKLDEPTEDDVKLRQEQLRLKQKQVLESMGDKSILHPDNRQSYPYMYIKPQ